MSVFPNSNTLLIQYQQFLFPGTKTVANDIINAIEKQDADAIEAMYSKDVKENMRNLNDRIKSIFNSLEGDIILAQYEKVYEDNASGKVTDEWFMQLSHKYEVERMELKAKIADLREKLKNMGTKEQNKDKFIKAIRKFMDMEKLTAPLLRELIDRIEVYETEGVGKNRTQRIAIYYKFIGYIEIPDVEEFNKVILEARKGVGINYLTNISAESSKKVSA